MNIGENIKKVRKEKGMLQKQVAAEVGLDQSNYNKNREWPKTALY
jgi:transcriptional regulator with XRE-family HTH domain